MKDALVSDKTPRDPNGNGWERNENKLQIRWTTKKPAPDEVLEFVICNCKKSRCETNKCPCFSFDMKCTDLCNCRNFSDVNTDEMQKQLKKMMIMKLLTMMIGTI